MDTTRRVAQPQFDRLAVCITEDWFALSHFQPLLRALRLVSHRATVVTRPSVRIEELRALGVDVVPFDYQRGSMDGAATAATAWRLSRVLASLRPDAVHLVAMQPILLGALCLERRADAAVGVHLTGLGHLFTTDGWKVALTRRLAVMAIARLLRRPRVHLFAENPDDLAVFAGATRTPRSRTTLLGGAGVDTDQFPAWPLPDNSAPVIAYVGRMIEPKGIADLVEAARILHRRGVAHRLELHGGIDSHNPTAIRAERLAEWQREGLIDWRGATRDVASVWRRCDIAVLASQGGEGMPRAMLEAASCARPLVVTDIPGCRHFVRDGQEGLVVPPRDPERLADAIARLAADRALRERMGLAARARVLDGFTEQQLEAAVAAVYRDLHAAPAFRS